MRYQPSLRDDLAILAARDRRHLGEPPDGETLVALRDGRLADDEASRVRRWLAVEPELASIYLDLDAALGGRLDAAPVAERVAQPSRFHRRRGALAALAAALIAVAGLVYWQFGIEHWPSPPDGIYRAVAVTGASYREMGLQVPAEAAGLDFHVAIEPVETSSRWTAELLDSDDHLLRRQRVRLGPGARQIVFRVVAAELVAGRTYRIVVRPVDPAPGVEIPPAFVFSPVFEE
jgi:hypothetical protein